MNTTRRWKYKIVSIKAKFFGTVDTARTEEQLASLGAQGWELVHIGTGGHLGANLLYFKRAA